MAKHARVLTDAEFEVLLEYVDNMTFAARNRMLVYLSHKAGMRVGEIASLRTGDLVCSIDNGRASNDFTFVAGGSAYSVVPQIQLRASEVKAAYARSVHLSSSVQSQVLLYFSSLPDIDVDAPVFINRSGNKMTNIALAQEFRRIYMDLGFGGASSHSGRRGFVTGLLDRQVNIRTVQQLVGHRQLNTTQLYAESRDSALRDAVELL